MLTHGQPEACQTGRVVVFGGTGFIGRHLVATLRAGGQDVIDVGSRDLDLEGPEAKARVHALLEPTDTVVMLSALTPRFGRDVRTLCRNLEMAEPLCAALADKPVAHVVYASSDAVYAMGTDAVIDEGTPAAPTDLYGLMHRTREVMFGAAVRKTSLAIVRPTMVIGPGDPHGSYGPGRFLSEACTRRKITLGGEGADRRDYVYVADVASLLQTIILRRSYGTLNIASGISHTARDVAMAIEKVIGIPIEICYQPRAGAATSRNFNITSLSRAFPDFEFTSLSQALSLTLLHRQQAASPP
ncbi:MAG: NAD(P)-dependent oxidoreductase [Hyphomicrobiales bacterium]|nr:MAG: NAD(P)-dependent oxidoreductase [Hyphomicrobiales bacterium]